MLQSRSQVYSWGLLFLLFIGGSPAAAGGLNLAWNHCLGEGTGARNASFACNTNLGAHPMVGSFVLSEGLSAMSFIEFDVQIASASATLPEWWSLYLGHCRNTTPGFNFTADPNDAVCVDWGEGSTTGTLALNTCQVLPGTSSTCFMIGMGLPFLSQTALDPEVEYFSFNLLINHSKTVGAGSCPGCEVAVSIALSSANFGLGDGVFPILTLSGPASPGSNCITWQGTGALAVGVRWGCPAATPTGRSTWAGVKALYR